MRSAPQPETPAPISVPALVPFKVAAGKSIFVDGHRYAALETAMLRPDVADTYRSCGYEHDPADPAPVSSPIVVRPTDDAAGIGMHPGMASWQVGQ